jgi:hypothetical protein
MRLDFKETEGHLCKIPGIIKFWIYISSENSVSLVHGSWTTRASVHRGSTSIADRRRSSELGLRQLRATAACRNCTGRTRSSLGFSLGPHLRQRGGVATGDGSEEVVAAALSVGGAWGQREEKWCGERCGVEWGARGVIL